MKLPKHPFPAFVLWLCDSIKAFPHKPYLVYTGPASGVCAFRFIQDALLHAEPLVGGGRRISLIIWKTLGESTVLKFGKDKLGRMRYPRAILRRLGKIKLK